MKTEMICLLLASLAASAACDGECSAGLGGLRGEADVVEMLQSRVTLGDMTSYGGNG